MLLVWLKRVWCCAVSLVLIQGLLVGEHHLGPLGGEVLTVRRRARLHDHRMALRWPGNVQGWVRTPAPSDRKIMSNLPRSAVCTMDR